MPDENIQNPQDDQAFTIKPENLDANAADAPAEAPAETQNPLNTGDGAPTADASVEAPAEPTAETPAPEAPAEPQDITPEVPAADAPAAEPNPKDLDKKLDEQLSNVDSKGSPEPDKSSGSKKYIVIVIVLIGLITIGYFVYPFIFGGSDEAVEENESLNTLSSPETDENVPEEPSEKLEQLDEIIDELEDVYAPEYNPEVFEDAVIEEVDNSFPSLTPIKDIPADEPIIDEPIVDEPILDKPIIDEPAPDEPIIDPTLGTPPLDPSKVLR